LEKFEMKKTLVAVAALAAVTGAMAEVSITGHLDQGLTSVSQTTSGATVATYSGTASIMAPSFITFSGNEDLGSGLKAVFKVENGLNMNSSSLLSDVSANWNSSESGNNREAWVGLGGEFGEVKLGTQYNPAFWTLLTLDPGAINNAPGVLFVGQVANVSGLATNNATTYTSASFSGITFNAQVQSGIGNSATANQGSGFGYSLTYAAGALYASAAYNSTTITAASRLSGGTTNIATATRYKTATTGSAGDAATVTAVGASYDFGVAKLGYLNTQTALNSYSSNMNLAAITVPYGAASFGYSYSSGSVTGASVINQNGQQLNVTYNFSKRTNAYLAYGVAKDTTNNDTYGLSSVGIAHSF